MHVLRSPGWWRWPLRAPATVLAAALVLAWLLVAPPVVDLAAAFYRSGLFGAHGWLLWDNNWYGGSYVLGYSVLYPPLAALIGARLLGALAGVATAAAAERLIHIHYGRDGRLAACWLALGIAAQLLSGRITFVLGLVGVVICALALDGLLRHGLRSRRGASWLALMLAAALFSGMASPVAALFTGVVGAAVVIAGSPRRIAWPAGLAAALVALVPVAALSLAFPQSGYEPFTFATLWPVLASGAALLVALGLHRERGARTGTRERVLLSAAAIYLLGCLLTAAIHTPIGANVARLGDMAAGPLIALVLYPRRHQHRQRRRWTLAALVIVCAPLLYIQLFDGFSDAAHGASDGASDGAYFQPLINFLRARPGGRTGAFRVEVPFTDGHWESDHVARLLPLARGWERQRDIGVDPIFYRRGALTAASYRAWLGSLAVAYVAVPDVQPDYSARAEVALIDRGLPYLKLVARLSHWRVYALRAPAPMVSGAARLVRLEPDSVVLRFTHAGSANVSVRFSPYWELVGVRGCVSDDGGFDRVRADGRGSARLRMAFAPGRIGARSPRCN
jgi:hypothetical protein